MIPEQAWPFWKSADSAYLNAFRERSGLLPEGAVHAGINLVADVIAAHPPKVTVIAPSAGIAGAHCKENELQGCVKVPMERSEDQFLNRRLSKQITGASAAVYEPSQTVAISTRSARRVKRFGRKKTSKGNPVKS